MKAFGGAVMLSLVVSLLTVQGVLYLNPLLPLNTQGVPAGFKFSITHGLLAGFCAFGLALYAGHVNQRWARVVLIGLALIAVHNTLFIVISRTGYLVVAVLIAYLCIAHFRWRGIAVAAILGVALFGVSYYGSSTFEERVDTAVSELHAWQPDKAADTSVGMRMDFYRSSVNIIRQHPLFGSGTGSFPAIYEATVNNRHMEETSNPHNEYLLIAIQIGLVGLAGLLYLFYIQWRMAARLTPLYRDLARGLVIVFIIGCLFNSLLLDHTEGLFFAWATGLCFAGLAPPSAKSAA
jgi:O-antigen ligase